MILLLGENQSVFLPTILSRSVKIILSEEDAAENGGEPEESATGAFLKKGPNATESDVIALSRRFKKEKSAKKAADDPKEAIEEVRAWLRRALGVKTRAESGSYELKRAADALSYEKLNELLAAVETADERILRNVDGELTMGVLFRTIRNAYEVKE